MALLAGVQLGKGSGIPNKVSEYGAGKRPGTLGKSDRFNIGYLSFPDV